MQTDKERPEERYESAVALAVRAPSLHNTQPWLWHITSGGLELRADRSRQLPATDMDGHALLLACGAGLELARLSLRAGGWDTRLDRFPDPSDPDLLARLATTDRIAVTDEALRAVRAAEHRRSERRPFDARPVPQDTLDALRDAVGEPGLYLDFVTRSDERLDLAVAAAWADRYEHGDRGYRHELAEWTGRGPGAREGVPPWAIPHAAEGQRHTEVPIRDFEEGARGELAISGRIDEQPAFAVLFTTADDSDARLRAGQALMRVLIRAEELGLASSMISQPIDFPGVRARVRTLMSWVDYPRMLLRLGYPHAGEPVPRTPRREVGDVAARRQR